jgi:hypothetical protein
MHRSGTRTNRHEHNMTHYTTNDAPTHTQTHTHIAFIATPTDTYVPSIENRFFSYTNHVSAAREIVSLHEASSMLTQTLRQHDFLAAQFAVCNITYLVNLRWRQRRRSIRVRDGFMHHRRALACDTQHDDATRSEPASLQTQSAHVAERERERERRYVRLTIAVGRIAIEK